ncbi:MAG TPA: ankyrin repeat domain-containing protein [Stellaceae bacterium]|jgi:ankyrin repeat protein
MIVRCLYRRVGLALAAILLSGVAAHQAAAQKAPPTPFTGIPTVPKTLPLLGHGTIDGQVLAAATQGDAGQIDWVMAAGGNADEADKDGHTALMRAAMANFSAVAQVLLAHEARVDLRDKLGETALHWAAQMGSVGVLRVLLDFHPDVDAADSRGITPLMLAASHGKIDAVRLLLQYHADPRKTDYTGRDALGWANSNPRIVSALETATAAR